MRDFVIAMDSDTEIPYTFAEQKGIPVCLMPYTVDGEEKLYDLGRPLTKTRLLGAVLCGLFVYFIFRH